jgi:hypothetical protein
VCVSVCVCVCGVQPMDIPMGITGVKRWFFDRCVVVFFGFDDWESQRKISMTMSPMLLLVVVGVFVIWCSHVVDGGVHEDFLSFAGRSLGPFGLSGSKFGGNIHEKIRANSNNNDNNLKESDSKDDILRSHMPRSFLSRRNSLWPSHVGLGTLDVEGDSPLFHSSCEKFLDSGLGERAMSCLVESA